MSASGTLRAHEVTHTGTVVFLKTSKYAQPSGGFREVQETEVTVVDPKTKKSTPMVFTITERTRLKRDGKRVNVADAEVKKDEPGGGRGRPRQGGRRGDRGPVRGREVGPAA